MDLIEAFTKLRVELHGKYVEQTPIYKLMEFESEAASVFAFVCVLRIVY